MGMLGFYLCGFAFMFGGMADPDSPSGGGIATMGGYAGLNHESAFTSLANSLVCWAGKGFLLQGAGYDTAAFALFLFQMVFMDTTATIPTGGAAERWKFSAFMIYGCCIGTIMYPVFGNWVWGGGWLANLGANFGSGPRPRGFRRLLGGAHARRRHLPHLLPGSSGRATANTTRKARSFTRSRRTTFHA